MGKRRLAIGLGLALLVVIALAYSIRLGGTGTATLPTGIFVPNDVVGTASVDATLCVAISLDPEAVRTRTATIFLWGSGSACRSGSSGILTQVADLLPATLEAGNGLPVRAGYELSFVVQLLPSGSRHVRLSLDPEYASRHGLALAGIRAGESAVTISYYRVDKLSIPGTEDRGPVPTPALAPTP